MPRPALTFALAASLILAGCGADSVASAGPAAPVAVATAPAATAAHATSIVLPGTVRSATAAILMARVAGAVGRISATPGATVAAGAVLVELDALELAAQRDQAQAVAAQAAADFERAKTLFDKQALTKAEFDAAQARAAGSAAAAAQAAIMVGYTRITAPFAGVVVRKHAEVGDLLSPGRPVIEIEDPAAMRLEVEIPESLAAGIALGAQLRVQVEAAAIDQVAAVVEVIPAADPVSRSVLVKLALPATAAGLRSGQFGRVSLPIAQGQVLSVPITAVVQRGQLDAVFVVEGGRAVLRLVRLGGQDGDRSIIRAGLTAGEAVVLDPGALRDGQPVVGR